MSTLSPAAKDLVAGTSSGIVSVLVCHPLDTIRVRLQTAPPGKFNGIADVVRQTVKGEGPLALYKGILSPITAQALQKATMFYSFGAAKRFIQGEGNGHVALPLWQLYLCGSIAGIANSMVASPFELVRNRLQVQYQRNIANAQYKGPIDVVRQIVAATGVRSLWLGVVPMMIRDAPGVGAWYCTNEAMRRVLIPAGQNPAQAPKWKILLAGATAGIGFWVFAFPQDTIKNVIQTRGMNMSSAAVTVGAGGAAAAAATVAPPAPLGFLQTGIDLVRREGWGRLWKGFPIAALRGIPGAGSTFLTYQLVLNHLNERK